MNGRWILGVIGASAFTLGIGSVWAYRYQSQLILSQPVHAWTLDQTAQCAVVLTGGPGRIREGLDLLYLGKIKKLIIAGVHPKVGFSDIFPLEPYYGGSLEKDVLLEKRSTTTYGNAQQSLPLVEAFGCKKILLITSRVHMYRSLRTFNAVFPETIEIEPRAVAGASLTPKLAELGSEVVKSFFYNIWAY